jgi:AcrR family transcriptional regulator
VRVRVARDRCARDDPAVTGNPGGRREEKRRQTHARIFDEAMRLFRERGFDAVAVGDIARAAGVSVPTFYAHYESKDHLILALPTAEEVAGLIHAMPTEMPIVDMLRGLMVGNLTTGSGLEHPERVLERWRVIAASPALRLRAAEFERATATMVLGALPPEESASPRTQVTVTALMSAYTQVLLRWAESDGRRAPEEVVDEVLDDLRGMGL